MRQRPYASEAAPPARPRGHRPRPRRGRRSIDADPKSRHGGARGGRAHGGAVWRMRGMCASKTLTRLQASSKTLSALSVHSCRLSCCTVVRAVARGGGGAGRRKSRYRARDGDTSDRTRSMRCAQCSHTIVATWPNRAPQRPTAQSDLLLPNLQRGTRSLYPSTPSGIARL